MNKKAYKVLELCMDAEGRYYVNWAGAHGGQGGLTFRWGGLSLAPTQPASGLGDFVKELVERNREEWLERIKKKEDSND